MASDTVDPHDLVVQKDVEIVLKKDKGRHASLQSFEVKNFTNAGDNYVCLVTRVIVKYDLQGKDCETTYVVKLNPQTTLPENILKTVFDREIGFYEDIVPILNAKLQGAGEQKLRLPTYYHSVRETGRQIIYMSDLRAQGFRMHSRYESLDKTHTILIVKELGRLHAASHLMFSDEQFRPNKRAHFEKKFPYAIDFMDMDFDEFDMEKLFSLQIENAAMLLDGRPGYEYAAKFLSERKSDLFADITETAKPKEPFQVLCHGDCWNNNFLFKYSAKGEPIDCRILDLQGYKIGSGSLDLNHFLFTSISSSYRKENLQSILDCYYAVFSSVLSKPMLPMPFTSSFFKKDFHAHNNFGLMMAGAVVPTVLLKPEDAPKIADFLGENSEETIKRHGEMCIEKMRNSPLFKPRLLDTYDELRGYGAFNTTSVSSMIQKFSNGH